MLKLIDILLGRKRTKKELKYEKQKKQFLPFIKLQKTEEESVEDKINRLKYFGNDSEKQSN